MWRERALAQIAYSHTHTQRHYVYTYEAYARELRKQIELPYINNNNNFTFVCKAFNWPITHSHALHTEAQIFAYTKGRKDLSIYCYGKKTHFTIEFDCVSMSYFKRHLWSREW